MGEGLRLTLGLLVVRLGLWLLLGLQEVVRGLRMWTSRLGGGLDLLLRLVELRQRLEGGEGGLEGLKGGEKRLGPVWLLGRMDKVNLVLVVLRRGLWDHVVDVVDLRCTGMMVGLLNRMGSLRRGLGGLWVV